MAGGNVGLALGAEFRKEKLKDRPDVAASAGEVLGQGITATNGERDNYGVLRRDVDPGHPCPRDQRGRPLRPL